MKVGLVVHTGRRDCLDAAREALDVLHALGVDVVVTGPAPPTAELPAPLLTPDSFAAGLDLAVSFGGDGTLLHAAHLCRDAGIPVLGVNVGRFGFLAEVERDGIETALRSVAAGAFEVQQRPTLRLVIEDPQGAELTRGWALNEIAVEKSARQRLLRMEVSVSGTLLARIPADALIVATPTGSTAYALSAGGPLVAPGVEGLLVTPVAPHSLFDRTLVTEARDSVRIDVLAGQEVAVVSCDGRAPCHAPAGGAVVVTGGGRPVALARIAPPDFYGLVRRKFNLQ